MHSNRLRLRACTTSAIWVAVKQAFVASPLSSLLCTGTYCLAARSRLWRCKHLSNTGCLAGSRCLMRKMRSPTSTLLRATWPFLVLLSLPHRALLGNYHSLTVHMCGSQLTAVFAYREALDQEDEEPYFDPLEGNVAFGSAFDGWAFQIEHFAELSAPKLGCSAEKLRKGLWGQHYYSPKRKAVLPIKPEQAHKLTPLFVQVRLCCICHTVVCAGVLRSTATGTVQL